VFVAADKTVAAVTPSAIVGERPTGRHSLEILIKEPIQRLSQCGRIRSVVGMEASASNERLDFALA
jgi:hypothetical protein